MSYLNPEGVIIVKQTKSLTRINIQLKAIRVYASYEEI